MLLPKVFVSLSLSLSSYVYVSNMCEKCKKSDASKVYKWNWYAGTFEVFWTLICSVFGVSHLLYNSLHSNHRAVNTLGFFFTSVWCTLCIKYKRTVNNFFKNKWFRFLLFKQANKLVYFGVRIEIIIFAWVDLVNTEAEVLVNSIQNTEFHREKDVSVLTLNFCGWYGVEPINCVWWDRPQKSC